MNATSTVERLRVTGGDGSTAQLVGAHMLGELADRVGLSSAYSAAVPWTGERAPVHDRGRLLAQVAVMLAAGGRCVADMAALRDQPACSARWRRTRRSGAAFDAIDADVLDALRAAAGRGPSGGVGAPAATRPGGVGRRRVAGRDPLRAQAGAASHYKGGFGFHPMFCFTDDGEALAGILRPGNAAANSGADQLAVVDMAIAQLPADVAVGHRPGDDPTLVRERIVVRADTAGHVHAFVAGLVARNIEFSISARVSDLLDAAIMRGRRRSGGGRRSTPTAAPAAAPRSSSSDVTLPGVPAGTRIIVRRERPHQGAQLRLWDHDGLAPPSPADQQPGAARRLEVRHRRHGEVENRIKNAKDCGLERMPFTSFAANAAWMEMVLAAADLLVWTQPLLLARRARRRRTTHPALPDPARRRPPRPPRPPNLAAPPRALALDRRPARRLPASRRHHLTVAARRTRPRHLHHRVPNTARRSP